MADTTPGGTGASPHPTAASWRLGPSLRRAWVGYQRLVDEELEAAGFADRRFPDGRVLAICARSPDVTISTIGRELGITRQGASKIVETLRARGYVRVRASTLDGREKVVALTARASRYVAARREAARAIEDRLESEIGAEGFTALHALLSALGPEDEPRLREYLRTKLTGLGSPDG